jgi:hypothetical protein
MPWKKNPKKRLRKRERRRSVREKKCEREEVTVLVRL